MKLNFNGSNDKIKEAVGIANKILADPAFYAAVRDCPQFLYSSYDGNRVADELIAYNRDIPVDSYWWRSPFGSVATAKTQTVIKINRGTLDRPMESIVNTVIHESVHFVDWATNAAWDYTDRDVYEDPPKSATYVIGYIAEQMAPAYLNQP